MDVNSNSTFAIWQSTSKGWKVMMKAAQLVYGEEFNHDDLYSVASSLTVI